MKRTLIVVVVLFLTVFGAKGQVFEGGEFLITTYISGPNLTGRMMADVATISGFNNISHQSIPVFGLRLERIHRNHLGFLFEINYTTAKSTCSIPNSEGTFDIVTKLPQNRIMGGCNYHFGKSDKVSWYIGYCIGHHNGGFSRDMKVKNIYLEHAIVSDRFHKYENAMIYKLQYVDVRYSLRAQFGTYIFFSDHVGMNLEIGGMGGGLLKGGLTVKI